MIGYDRLDGVYAFPNNIINFMEISFGFSKFHIGWQFEGFLYITSEYQLRHSIFHYVKLDETSLKAYVSNEFVDFIFRG